MAAPQAERSEEHTSELQSRSDLVCRLLLEKKKRGQEPRHTASTYRGRAPGPAVRGARCLCPHVQCKWAFPRRRNDRDLLLFFFFNDRATPEISPLSLHDALPI